MKELDDTTYNRILLLCGEGDLSVIDGNFEVAIEKFKSALDLLPIPQIDWETATWVYVALGDTYYCINEFSLALDNLMEAMKCPGGISNPFIMLRVGQCFFNLDSTRKAKDFLLQAYMLGGIELFANEDIKYFELIKDII